MDTVVITALDQEGRGVARVDGKAVFVEGALIGERVGIEVVRSKRNCDLARVTELYVASPARVTPPCPYFGVCGGCSLQHLDPAAQVASKQRVLEDALWHIGRVRAGEVLAPIHGSAWGYRHRARFSVRDVAKKGGILVGFHERKSSYVADMQSCLVVPARISALLPELRVLIARLSSRLTRLCCAFSRRSPMPTKVSFRPSLPLTPCRSTCSLTDPPASIACIRNSAPDRSATHCQNSA
jgi:23S rRNA (uracil1939-C5)-methyltransferase